MWLALGPQGRILATAPHVVVTAAYGSNDLLAPWVADMSVASPLRPVKGQMTLAPLVGEPMAPHAMRQHGVFVPAYSDSAHPIAPPAEQYAHAGLAAPPPGVAALPSALTAAAAAASFQLGGRAV